MSASAMWAGQCRDGLARPDALDGKCHLTVANLRTMPHRSHEWWGTLGQLAMAFDNDDEFVVNPPAPPRSATKVRPTTCVIAPAMASRA